MLHPAGHLNKLAGIANDPSELTLFLYDNFLLPGEHKQALDPLVTMDGDKTALGNDTYQDTKRFSRFLRRGEELHRRPEYVKQRVFAFMQHLPAVSRICAILHTTLLGSLRFSGMAL
jgi:hypothetical protein